MTNQYATADDFSRWRNLARDMSSDTLRHASRDCWQASRAMAGHNPGRENYYADQAMTYDQELIERSKGSR